MKPPKMRMTLGRALAAMRQWPWLVPSGRARLVSLVLGVLVFAGASAQAAVAWVTGLPDNAVLRAGDTVITEEEFQQRVNVLEALYGVKPPKQGPKRDRFNRDAAKSLAVSLIIDRAAQDNRVVITDKKAQLALNKIIDEQLSGGRQDFVDFLGTQHISERDVIDEVKRQLATSSLFEKITADVKPVTGKEVWQEYQTRKEELILPEQRHLRNIVVESEAKASTVLQQAKEGTDFKKLAAQHSIDRSTKGKGGDLGTLTAGQLDKRFSEAAFQAKNKGYFGPVRSKHGWNVGQVVEIRPAKRLSFDQVRKQLEAEMNNRRKLEAWRSWLTSQIKQADVEYADEYRPANPDAPPAGTVRE